MKRDAAPTREALHEAALSYLSRSAATASAVTKTLERRVNAWRRRALRAGADEDEVERDAARARAAIAIVVERLCEVGIVNDAAYAEARAGSLARSGHSRRAIVSRLAAKGVDAEIVREKVPRDARLELAAAVAFARKRRIGPFAREPGPKRFDEDGAGPHAKALGAMARAGFDFSVCERVLRMDLDDAEALLREHR
ncbi:MAG: RecX family transcriptional regulator [Labilithrix sp.]|nr:RecX family transcriptional regulator [Labilithrix sp.]